VSARQQRDRLQRWHVGRAISSWAVRAGGTTERAHRRRWTPIRFMLPILAHSARRTSATATAAAAA
jgi:hypothetical protein